MNLVVHLVASANLLAYLAPEVGEASQHQPVGESVLPLLPPQLVEAILPLLVHTHLPLHVGGKGVLLEDHLLDSVPPVGAGVVMVAEPLHAAGGMEGVAALEAKASVLLLVLLAADGAHFARRHN